MFLLYNSMSQLYAYIYPLPSEPPSNPLPHHHPTPLGHHRAYSSLSLAACFTLGVYLHRPRSPNASPHPVSTYLCSASASLSLPCKQAKIPGESHLETTLGEPLLSQTAKYLIFQATSINRWPQNIILANSE